MPKIIRSFLLLTLLILSLNGCDAWDDLVDSISGSGDDNPTPIEEEVAVTKVTAAPKVTTKPKATGYESKFHHTSTGSSDGGKALVLCPGQRMNFDRCSAGDVDIPYHGLDDGRVIYWNIREEPRRDIVCVKNGRRYKYKANSVMVNGSCG